MHGARATAILLAILLAPGLATAAAGEAPPPASPAGRILNNAEILADKDRVGYAVGVSLGRRLKQQGTGLDVDAVTRGVRDALTGAAIAMSEEELQATVSAVTADAMRRQRQANSDARATVVAEAAANQKAGDVFLAANAVRPGVVTLPSGLQYKVLRAGSGPKPAGGSVVTVHYRGTLVDGTEFDSSYARGAPSAFRMADVIPGWAEALRLMGAGSRWQLAVPARLAYGAQGSAPRIGPNATLVFEIELLGAEADAPAAH